jgi:predicted anti-sigma-YlaC factor YlaD
MNSQIEEMTCKEIVELVTEYLEGTLAAHDIARFEEHLALCEGCVNYLDQMRMTIALSGRLSEDSLTPQTRAAFTDAFRAWKSGETL